MSLSADAAKAFRLTDARAGVTLRAGDPTLKDIAYGSTTQIASRAIFTLDVAGAGSAQRDPVATSDTARERRRAACRILVADDNEDAAQSLAILLRMQGHEVRMARDGVQALDVAADFHPDVLLLDIGMPRLDGCEVARRLRAADGGADLVLLALSGWGRAEDEQRSLEAGFDRHLAKPVDLERLERCFGELLAARAR